MSTEADAKTSTDRILWSESSDWGSPIVFITEGGGLGIDVGGSVVVLPARAWHALAHDKRADQHRTTQKTSRIVAISVRCTECDGRGEVFMGERHGFAEYAPCPACGGNTVVKIWKEVTCD